MSTSPTEGRGTLPADFDPDLVPPHLVGQLASHKMLIDGILRAGEPMLLAGPEKSLKTSVTVDMAYSLASGTAFMGRYNVPEPKRVWYYAAEPTARQIDTIGPIVAESKGISLESLAGNFAFSFNRKRFDNLASFAWLKEKLTKFKPDVAFVDCAYVTLPSEGSSDMSVKAEHLRDLDTAVMECGAQLVLVHHSKKNIGCKKPEFDHVTGAGFSAWCRQWVFLNRRSKYKHGTGLHNLHMVLSQGFGSGHRITIDEQRWSVSFDDTCDDPAEATEKASPTERWASLLLERLKEKTEPASLRSLGIGRDINPKYGKDAINLLVDRGEACKSGKGYLAA